MHTRDNFNESTKRELADSVGTRCSNPKCRRATKARKRGENATQNEGVAAHICAAAKGGPRYDPDMDADERKSFENGLWLCSNCATLIDNDANHYTVKLLKEWKRNCQQMALAELEGDYKFDFKKEYNIDIRSFVDKNVSTKEFDGKIVDLIEYFEGRFLKDGYQWENIMFEMKNYIQTSLPTDCQYHVTFAAQFSIAFLVGRILNPKSGIETISFQKTAAGLKAWEIDSRTTNEYDELSLRKEIINEKNCNVAIIISLTRNIESSAKEYIMKENLAVGTILYCSIKNPGVAAVVNGEHSWRLCQQINTWIEERSNESKKGMLHMFVASPVVTMFHLGKMSLSYGKGQIYDHDFENVRSGTYFPAANFIEGDWL